MAAFISDISFVRSAPSPAWVDIRWISAMTKLAIASASTLGFSLRLPFDLLPKPLLDPKANVAQHLLHVPWVRADYASV